VHINAQEYNDYQDYADGYAGQDNLYSNYQQSHQDQGAPVKTAGGGPGLLKTVAVGGIGWFLGGKFHAGRTVKALKKKHMKDQKNLYSQYYNDVYKLQQQNAELTYVVQQYKEAIKMIEEEKELEAVQRDYDEFKQPDVDGDDRISRAEFNSYVKNYLSNYPGLKEEDYPDFSDFDHDGDGYISFQEYGQQMALTLQQAENAALKS